MTIHALSKVRFFGAAYLDFRVLPLPASMGGSVTTVDDSCTEWLLPGAPPKKNKSRDGRTRSHLEHRGVTLRLMGEHKVARETTMTP